MEENAKSLNKSSDKPEKKKSFWKGLKAEFSKIVWPSSDTLKKETSAVLFYSAVLALLIMGLDFIFQFGIDKLLSW